MKTRVIPSEASDLSKGDGAHLIGSVIQTPWARSFALLRMTAYMTRHYKKTLLAFSLFCTCAAVTWFVLPKPSLLEGVSFSQSVRDRNGKLLRVTLTTD